LLHRKPKFILNNTIFHVPSSFLISRITLNQIKNYPLWFFLILIHILLKFFYRNYLAIPQEKPTSKNVLANNNFIRLVNDKKILYIQDNIKRFTKDTVILKSGKYLKVDLVLLATGYKQEIPFMKKFKLSQYRYKYIIDPNIHNCAFIGHCSAYNWLQISEIQSIWYINVILGNIKLPAYSIFKKDINIRKQKNTEYYDLTYEAFDYCDELLNDIKYNRHIIKDLGYWLCKPLF